MASLRGWSLFPLLLRLYMRDAVLHTNCQLLSVNCGLWCLKCSDVDECLQASAFHSGSSATLHSLITGGVSEQGRPCFNHRESKSLTAFPSAEPVCLGGNVLILSVLYTPRSQCNQKKKKKNSYKCVLYPLQTPLGMGDILIH